MAIIVPSKTTPRALPHMQRVRNGIEPDHRTAQEIARRHAYYIAHARKGVFAKHVRFNSLPQGSAGTTTQWRWLCRTGDASGAVTLRARVGLLPGTNGAGADPKVRMAAYDGSTTTYSDYVAYWTDSSATPGLSDILWAYMEIEDLDADTEYQCHFESVDYCRVASAAVFESVDSSLSDTSAGITDTGYYDGLDILDAQHSELTEHGHSYWRHNAQQLVNVVPDWPGLAKLTTSSTTYINALGGSATPASNTPGVYVATQYKNPVHSDDIACVVGVWGKQSAGVGGNVAIVDSNGSTLATLSLFTTAGSWKTTTLNLDGASATHKLDFHMRASAGNTITVEAISIYQYTA